MSVCQIIYPPRFDRYRRLSRSAAFRAQGVSLKYMASSWSGVRADDGMVVFAVRAEEVVRDAEGSRCLLWQAPHDGTDSPAQRERLQHCRLALLRRCAEALVAHGEAAEIDPDVVLAVRVEALGGQFWARWGPRAAIRK